MIELHKHGKTVLFDDTGVDRDNPGFVRIPLYLGAFYEEKFLEYIRTLDKHGVYVDVGAHIGTHSIYFAMLCDSTHVYAVEPRGELKDEFVRNLKLNGIDSKVTVLTKGAGRERNTVSVTLDKKTVSFECAPLDELIPADAQVTLLKIDVEGMELSVLEGATRILRESKPIIFAEAHDAKELRTIEGFLAKYDYTRSGRVFNRSPTYEFMHSSDALVDLREHLNKQRHLLETARGSLAFRLGRATAVALREEGRTPWRIPRRWWRVFNGPDDILDGLDRERSHLGETS